MRFLLPALILPLLAHASIPEPDSSGKYHLTAPGLKASFITYGASLTNLIVPDHEGKERDVALGYDLASDYYPPNHNPHYGGIPGRYANRIKNSTFELDGVVYRTTENDRGNTLHGGPKGWDRKNWTVESYTSTSITFSLLDPAGANGFPGDVKALITYSVEKGSLWMRINAMSLTERTPIMATSHTYWNLDGFEAKEKAVETHELWINRGEWAVDVDGLLIPTGTLFSIPRDHFLDFHSAPKTLARQLSDTKGKYCGPACSGYDNCLLSHRPSLPTHLHSTPLASLHSTSSRISLKIFTNQPALQVYTCNTMDGSIPLKKSQTKGGKKAVEKHDCVVLEAQEWIDGINNPEWGREEQQVFGPRGSGYEWWARYEFGILGKR